MDFPQKNRHLLMTREQLAGGAGAVSEVVESEPELPQVDENERRLATMEQGRVYTAYGAARKLWGCKDEEALIDGPAGTGKTRALLERAHIIACKYPNIRILLLRKIREDMTNSVLTTFEEKVLPEDSPLTLGSKRSLRQEYIYPNKSRIVVAGLDKAQKVMSSEWDMILVFEALEISENDYEYLLMRLRNGKLPWGQQIVLDCNPAGPQHWIWKRYNKGLFTRFKSIHEDNPFIYDQKTKELTRDGGPYMARLDRLTGVRHKRYRLGLWVGAEGAVFETFDYEKHVIMYGSDMLPFKKIPDSWTRIISVDFGFTKPFVAQWWAIDEDKRMYMYREIYMTRRIVQDHAKQMLALSAGEKIAAVICDWDAEGRATMEREGIHTIQAFKDFDSTKDAVIERLKIQADGKPRIMFLADSLVEKDHRLEDDRQPLRTTEEFDYYVWKKSRGDETAKLDKDEPIDEYDHGCDSLRYACAWVDRLSARMVNVRVGKAVVVGTGTGMVSKPMELKSLYSGQRTTKNGMVRSRFTVRSPYAGQTA